MKILKILLIVIFSLIEIGILGKTIFEFPGADFLFSFSILLYILMGFIYFILTMKFKQNRIEGSMIASSELFVLGLLFSTMHWPGAGVLITVGSQMLFVGSLSIFIYLLVKKRDITFSTLFLTIGLSSIFVLFKLMFWPGSQIMFFPVAAGIIVSVFLIFYLKEKIDFKRIILILILTHVVFLFFSKTSSVYRFKYINNLNSQLNNPENYYKYAFYLNREGKTKDSKENLQLAIQEAQNTNNFFSQSIFDGPENAIKRYKKAIQLIDSNSWNELEEKEYN